MGTLTLPNNKGVVLFDDEDANKLIGLTVYPIESNGSIYPTTYINGKAKTLAHIISPPATGHYIKYANGNTLDIRKENLQPTRRRSSRTNFTRAKGRTSPYQGVSYHANTRKYIARVYAGKQQIWLGSFDTAEQAAVVRDAYLNPPTELAVIRYGKDMPTTVGMADVIERCRTQFRKNLIRTRASDSRRQKLLEAALV